jgi:hypothetical protein
MNTFTLDQLSRALWHIYPNPSAASLVSITVPSARASHSGSSNFTIAFTGYVI